MRKFWMTGCAVLLACALLAGCKGDTQVTETTPTEQPQAQQTPAQAVDPLNGASTANEYKPLAVMIDNSEAARPQHGLQAADVVYECRVEGGMSRLMLILNSEIPEKVGPVRSARKYYATLAAGFDAIYAHYGAAQGGGVLDVYKYIESENPFQIRIDGLGNDYGLTYRDSSRSAPHNAYLKAKEAVALYDYTPQVHAFQFDASFTPSGGSAQKVETGLASASYVYDEESGMYLRSQNGQAHRDAITGEQVQVKNLIIQYATYTYPEGGQLAEVIGSGKCQVAINGQYMEGTWSKAGLKDPTIFKDANGNEITLQPGNTWIHVVPDTSSATFE